MKRICFVMLVALLGGCATQVPTPISTIPAGDVSLAEVRQKPDRFTGTEVRWGGVIARVENKAEVSWVEVVGRRLKSNGEPVADSHSSGRFIASIQGFVDPVVYGAGQMLTVVGVVDGQTSRPIGEYDYTFPVVKVTASYLWPVREEPEYYPPPWWYYDPWWPYPRHYYPGPRPPRR